MDNSLTEFVAAIFYMNIRENWKAQHGGDSSVLKEQHDIKCVSFWFVEYQSKLYGNCCLFFYNQSSDKDEIGTGFF